jgi:hypothetical protein
MLWVDVLVCLYKDCNVCARVLMTCSYSYFTLPCLLACTTLDTPDFIIYIIRSCGIAISYILTCFNFLVVLVQLLVNTYILLYIIIYAGIRYTVYGIYDVACLLLFHMSLKLPCIALHRSHLASEEPSEDVLRCLAFWASQQM